MQRKTSIIILALLLVHIQVKAQFNQGTEFWMGFMEHVDKDKNTKVLMITSEYDTKGWVGIPMKGWRKDFTVAANEVKLVELPLFSETIGSERKDSTGIYIRTQDPVSIYAHQYANARSEAALILPTRSLGKSYRVMSFKGYTERNLVFPSQFLIVATSNKTVIEMYFNDDTRRGAKKGGRGTVTLNRGQTFQVQGFLPESDLTGTYLRGNKPFAVFAGAVWTQVPGGCLAPDNLYEQMYPIKDWGNEFVAIPGQESEYELIRIMAAADDTRVYISGQYVSTLDSGEFLDRKISGKPVYIETSAPSLVAKYITSHECNNVADLLQGDPSMVLLNHLYQSSRVVTFYASSFEKISDNYLSILSRTKDVKTILLDGEPLEGFQKVPAKPEFSYLNLSIPNGPHQLTADGCGLSAYCYGYGRLESYSYATGAGFHLIEDKDNPIPDGVCLGDTLVFDHGIDEEYAKTWWSFGDSTFAYTSKASHLYKAPGTYQVDLVIHNLCINNYDTIGKPLQVIPPLKLEADPDSAMICAGDQLRLNTNVIEGAQYFWTGPNEFNSDLPAPSVKVKDSTWTGLYIVTASVPGCSSIPDTVKVTVRDPNTDLGPDTTLCIGDTFFLKAPAGNYSAFRWQNKSRDSRLRIFLPGYYWIETRDSMGCKAIDSLEVQDRCPPPFLLPNSFSPNQDQRNDVYKGFFPEVTEFDLRIFTLDGKQVFQSIDPDIGWDGTFEGNEMPEEVYRWSLFMVEPDPDEPEKYYSFRLQGKLTLVRWGIKE